MRRTLYFAVLAFGAVACNSTVADSDKKGQEGGKGAEVSLDGMRSRTPASWKEETPTSSMRLLQFRLPGKGEGKDAELVIFKNLGGSVRDNLARWKGQWTAPEGKSLDDVARVSDIKIGGHEATLLDIQGTYKPPPFDPTYKGRPQPDFRMLAIHFQGPDNLYHIKLTGPDQTVEEHRKEFEGWLKGFQEE